MPEAPITDAEIAQILSNPLIISESVTWARKNDDSWAEATVHVKHELRGIDLMVKLTANLKDRVKFSVSLLCNGTRIAALDIRGNHANTHTDKNRWVRQTHIHRWTDVCHGSWAYSPDSPFSEDPARAFLDFCQQFGIQFLGQWHDPPQGFQLELGET